MEFRNVCHTNVFSFVNKSMGPLREAGGREGGRKRKKMRKKRKKKRKKKTTFSYYRHFGTKIFHLWSDKYLSVINIDFQF